MDQDWFAGRGEDLPPDVPDADQGSRAGGDLNSLRRWLEEETSRADKYLANWQRTQADLSNFRKRTEQEKGDLIRFAGVSLVGRLLPVVDDLERALSAVPEQERSSGWVEGVRLIDRKLRSLLEQEGVVPIDALGRDFDPRIHEAVMREDGEGDVDVVVEEFQKGFKIHDRVIRPAMVKVGRRAVIKE